MDQQRMSATQVLEPNRLSCVAFEMCGDSIFKSSAIGPIPRPLKGNALRDAEARK